ncbi:AraC family transcriptional regulator ligand-binding domain-containing protein [Janthinobacterium sp. SUN118]|uniref:AraC family transcriptional regulator n=1 Tax=Janthinobacterium sp. SUN118 TaxID=3004100 RepID=UPI0025B24168|nr:AraC family transcriptional regulator [Janthinobacterium sp. SUN118]MDN2712467.1 AraC family transcriptional regulator ligand-binding domain-containing protein [Janthinobacterium sp. SUN118]
MTGTDNHPAEGRVAGAYLQPLLEAAGAHGISAAALARAAGVAPHGLDASLANLPARDYVRLLDAGAALAGDAHFGLHVGQRVRMGTYSAYGLILLSCKNVGQALEQTARYERLAHDLGRSSVQRDGDVAHYRWTSHYPAASRHLVDSVFAGIRVCGDWLAGVALPPARLAFTHDGGGELLRHAAHRDEYVRVLGSLPAFGAAANTATFDAQLLDWPVPNADVSLYPVLCQHAEQLLAQRQGEDGAGIEAQVHAAIVAGLRHGSARLAGVAAALAVTPRTLQRKLADADTSFQALLDQARYGLARDYLRQPGLSLVDIAFLLGYQEQSAFNHAFRTWAGTNPGAWRLQQLQARQADL